MDDRRHMGRALELARRGWGATSPNPMVGAVVVRDGEVVGEGFHERAGLPHAEANALAAAAERARGSTVYVTLEPCDHHGRTPPCTRALIDARVSRVVVAVHDPNPMVDGRGVAALRAAGIAVDVGVLADEAEDLNVAFARHVRTGLPFVVLKLAASLDGKAAAPDGSSRWISGSASRADAHRLRAWADAIVVGAGTALADDPALTVRHPGYAGSSPLRVVADATGRVRAVGRLFDGEAPTLVATTDAAPDDRIREWRSAGADVAVLEGDAAGGVSLPHLMQHLGKRDAQAVLVEGGPTLAFSAVRDGVVDRVVAYLAPLLVGGPRGAVGGDGFAPIGEAARLVVRSVERLGDDVRVEADVHRDR